MGLNAASINAFNRRAATIGQAANAFAFIFREIAITGRRTTIKKTREIEGGGFVPDYVCTIRLDSALALLSGAPPLLGEQIIDTTTSIVLRIDEVTAPGQWPEWILQCAAI